MIGLDRPVRSRPILTGLSSALAFSGQEREWNFCVSICLSYKSRFKKLLEKSVPYYLDICFPSDLEGQNSWTPQSSETGWDSAGVPSKSIVSILTLSLSVPWP